VLVREPSVVLSRDLPRDQRDCSMTSLSGEERTNHSASAWSINTRIIALV